MTGGKSAERSRSPLWRWPAVTGGVALLAALALARWRPAADGWGTKLPAGDHDSARALLQVTATSVMTATALTFSVTVVTLQLASQQFSPRLLREFTRDPVTKAVLSVLTGTFVWATTGLLVLDADEPLPRLLVVWTHVLAVGSIVAILALITHVARSVRVDTMMLLVHDEASAAIDTFYPPYGDESPKPPDRSALDAAAPLRVDAERSGFVQRTNVDALVEAAREHGAFVSLQVRAGDHIVRGTPIGTAWLYEHSGAAEDRAALLVSAVHAAMTVGYERTLEQDAAYGFRQLEDVAVKAMSPSVNDPATAAHAVGHMGDLLVRLAGCRLGPTVHLDADDVPRATVPDRDMRYYLELACDQLRRFASGEPTVIVAMLRMLRDVAVACRDDEQRDEVRRAADLVATTSAPRLDADQAAVVDMACRVEHALAGRLDAAYVDRSGETRSM